MGELLTKSLVRSGYFVHVNQDYQSRIRGGHNTFAIRAAAHPVEAPVDEIDILVALNQESIDVHSGAVRDGGLVMFGDHLKLDGDCVIRIPLKELAPKPIFYNIAALGALLFGGVSVLGLRLQAMGVNISTFFISMLPYVCTALVLIFTGRKRSAAPASLAVNYDREAR